MLITQSKLLASSTGGTGFAADTAIGLLMCGPEANANVDDYLACTDERLRFIPGFKGGGAPPTAFNVGLRRNT